MVNWLVDEILNERLYETGFPTIAEAAKELGHKVYQTKYIKQSISRFQKDQISLMAFHLIGEIVLLLMVQCSFVNR